MQKVLSIVPFNFIYPPMNGGMQRCFNIIHQLAKYFELTIIIHQKKEQFLLAVSHYPAINNVNVYSTHDASKPKDVFNFFHERLQNALRYRWYKKKLNGPADGHFLKYYSTLKMLLQKEKFDVVILENLSTINSVSLIRKYDTKVNIIYDAHNVDTNLAESSLKKNQITLKDFSLIKNAESSMYKVINTLLVCSEDDKDAFLKLNKKNLPVSIIPNGVNIISRPPDDGVRSDNPVYILFCGALNSRPNSEGLLWFCTSIWPKVKKDAPQLKLLVVGSGELPVSMKSLSQDMSLIFTGKVGDVKEYYELCAISIVPLKTGSGTRLKILEAMCYGLPVISTTKGGEGIEYTDDHDILIADEENVFAEKIIQLLNNKEQRLSIQLNGRKLVAEKYDWNIIGKKLADVINQILSSVK